MTVLSATLSVRGQVPVQFVIQLTLFIRFYYYSNGHNPALESSSRGMDLVIFVQCQKITFYFHSDSIGILTKSKTLALEKSKDETFWVLWRILLGPLELYFFDFEYLSMLSQ